MPGIDETVKLVAQKMKDAGLPKALIRYVVDAMYEHYQATVGPEVRSEPSEYHVDTTDPAFRAKLDATMKQIQAMSKENKAKWDALPNETKKKLIMESIATGAAITGLVAAQQYWAVPVAAAPLAQQYVAAYYREDSGPAGIGEPHTTRPEYLFFGHLPGAFVKALSKAKINFFLEGGPNTYDYYVLRIDFERAKPLLRKRRGGNPGGGD